MSQVLTDGNDNTGAAQNVVYALDGNDLVFSNQPAPALYGGEGSDFLGNFGVNAGRAYGGQGFDNLHGGTVSDQLYGEDGNDLLVGGEYDYSKVDAGTVAPFSNEPSGDDYLDGGADVDSLWGFEGNDTLLGGAGNDTDDLSISVRSPNGTGVLSTVAAGLYGGSGNDFLDGGSGSDYLDGGADNDTVEGGDGNDLVNGGTGIDLMRGGAGSDVFLVDNAADFVVEGSGDGLDTVIASTSYALDRFAEIELLLAVNPSAATGLHLTGSDTANAISGDAGNNILNGLGGNDTVLGLAGKDRLDGGLGNDSLNGGDGNDVIAGGEGKDTLVGGAGKDAFVFNAAPGKPAGTDRIVGFRSADDVIRIDNAFFKQVGPNGVLNADAFHLGKTAADAEDRIIYDRPTGALYYDPDGTGSAAQIKFAVLANKASVVLSDFVVI